MFEYSASSDCIFMSGLTHQIGGKKLEDVLHVMFSVSSSGGNAGLAAALACKKMGLPCTVIVPGSTPQVNLIIIGSLQINEILL